MNKAFDLNDEKTRRAMGEALRKTYEVDAALPDALATLMHLLQQRLDRPTDTAGGRKAVEA